MLGELPVEKICLKCLKFSKDVMEEHPFLIGSLCKECSVCDKKHIFISHIFNNNRR